MFLSPSVEGNLADRIDEELRLPSGYDYTLNGKLWKFLERIQARWPKWKWLAAPFILVRGLEVVFEKPVKHILAVPLGRSETFMVAACCLHCITRIPMSVYFFDMFDLGQKKNLKDRLLSVIERIVIRLSSNVFVMSEPLDEHYRHKYGVDPVLLPHPVDLNSYTLPEVGRPAIVNKRDLPLKIVFTGMIYESQLDSILNLVNVVNELPDVEFHIYTPITEEKRRWMGISGANVVFHGPVSHTEIPGILQGADILFLPMAFDYVYPHMIDETPADKLLEQRVAGKEIIRTASPSKLPEYLAAGRPILIHAPEYSYVAWYGKNRQCAEVVDSPDLQKLRDAVLRLQNDKSRCDCLVANARKTVLQHDSVKVSELMQQCLGMVVSDDGR